MSAVADGRRSGWLCLPCVRCNNTALSLLQKAAFSDANIWKQSHQTLPWLECLISDDALFLLRNMLPDLGISQVHQSFGVQEAKPKPTVDHQSSSVPFPAWVIGQGVKLRRPNHQVLEVSPGEIRTRVESKRIHPHLY